MSKKDDRIERTSFFDRACHWTLVICFFLVAMSGIALFFPSLQWLSQTFGTPQLGRILHPFLGVVIFLILAIMFTRFVKHNLFEAEDKAWFANIGEVAKGNEHEVADVGKYNPGQKLMFWSIMVLISILLVTGIIMWRPYFAGAFPIPVIRVAILTHAIAAILLLYTILAHIYAAIWVKGTIQGMVEGKVSRLWAKKHHPRWYREIEAKEEKK